MCTLYVCLPFLFLLFIVCFFCSLSCSYEAACEEYTKALGLLHSSDDEEDDRARTMRASQLVIVEFVVNEVSVYIRTHTYVRRKCL